MGFSDIFDPIVDGLEQRRKSLIQEQIQTETNNLSNQWLEKVNIHAMEMEQQGQIGAGYSEQQTQWFKEEESKILAQIKDARVRESFKQSSSNIRANFNISAKKQEIEHLMVQESRGVEADVNFQMGLISSAKNGAELDMNFKNVILGNNNNKIDNATNEDLRESFKETYAISAVNYVDTNLSLLDQEINNGTIKEEDYRARLANLQEFVTKDKGFYRNIPNKTFSSILTKVRGANENSSERFRNLRNNKIIKDLPAMKQSKIASGEVFTPDETEVVVNSYSQENREAARIDIEAFNSTIPYFDAKNFANIPGMIEEKQKIDKEVTRLLELKNPGLRLTVLQQAQAALTKDLNDTNKLAQENYFEFVRNHPTVKTAINMSETSAMGYDLVMDAVIEVATETQQELTFVEFIDDTTAGSLASNLLSEGVTSSDARGVVAGILQKYDKQYPGGNVADNVIRQVSEKLGPAGQAVMGYYDSPATFNVLWDAMVAAQSKSKEELYNGLGETSTDLDTRVNKKFDPLFGTLDQEQTNAHRELAKVAIASIMSSPNNVYNKKMELVDSLGKATNFVYDAMVKDAYAIVDDNRNKSVRVPRNVKGTDYTLASNIIRDSGFKQSVLDWFQTQDPDISLSGDIVDAMVIDDKTREFLKDINKEKLIESLSLKTSRDGMGVQLMMRIANGVEQPVVLKKLGEAVIPFDTIQSHRAFVGPYQTALSEDTFSLNVFGSSVGKNSKVRKEAKEAIRRDMETRKLINEDTFFDGVNTRQIEEEALGLTNDSKSVQENLDLLQQEIDASNADIRDLLQ
jgi:hypothetical protein